jgi:inorganic pyrophosphatase
VSSASSWWHYIPLIAADGIHYNMICEIPMGTTAKLELHKSETHNPIAQSLNKDGTVRHYSYGIPFFNYGFFPQTWEDDQQIDDDTGAKGDGDPIDVIEVGFEPIPMGAVRPVKVLGSYELLDQGKVIKIFFFFFFSVPSLR